MHGPEGEERKRRRHMLPVPVPGTEVAADSTTITSHFFCKDGRKISVGDCALFKPPHESPPFIGIILRLTANKEYNLKLGVNWLYRPAEVKLGKGILLEAAPNEIFYSLHKDEIPAASLLHPCKVAFLRKGVELPSGISSFVCRRVYDIANKCLWWLTDKDFINEQQEEVDQLIDKTQLEMHVRPGGHSPKPLNGPTLIPPLKSGSDGVQNSVTSPPSQVKGKKRAEKGDQGSGPIKRERFSKAGDGDSDLFRVENMLKSEIAKITEKGGLVDFDGVEKLVQLMQYDRAEKKIDLAGRIMLANVITATDKFGGCLERFVQLKGLPVLNEWLQEVHKGKVGDGSSPKKSDKSVEEFLLSLLRALDKLPVNLHALQSCNVGKSVNHLRSHKNLEIQKKARSLVDTWKKRVEVELKMNDVNSGSSQAVSWPNKSAFSDISHGGDKCTGGSSEAAIKNSSTPPSAMSVNETSSVASHHRKSSNGLLGSPVSGVQKVTALGKCISLNKNASSEKVTNSDLTCDRMSDMPSVDHSNNHRLIVKFPNPGRSPARSANRGSLDDASVMVGGASSLGVPEKHDRKVKGKSDAIQENIVADMKTGDGSSVAVLDEEHSRNGDESGKMAETLKAMSLSARNESKGGKAYEAPFSSMSALIESCVDSEASPVLSVGDDIGMNLLASVAAGEMSKSKFVSPVGSPGTSSPVVEETCTSYHAKLRSSREDVANRTQSQPENGAGAVKEKHGSVVSPLLVKDNNTTSFCEEKSSRECDDRFHASVDLERVADPCLKSNAKPEQITTDAFADVPPAGMREDGPDCDAANLVHGANNDGVLEFKPEIATSCFDDNKKIDCKDEKIAENGVAGECDFGSVGGEEDNDNATSGLKVEKSVQPLHKSSESNDKVKNQVLERSSGDTLEEQKELPLMANPSESMDRGGEGATLTSCSGNVLVSKNADDFRDEKADGMEEKSHFEHDEHDETLRVEQASNFLPIDQVEAGICSIASDCNSGAMESSDRKEVLENRSGGSSPHELPAIPLQEIEKFLKSGVEADETKECMSNAEASSSSIAEVSGISVKLDFDLNEGFPMDEGNQSESPTYMAPGCSSAIHLPVSTFSSLPASITVAAAAKRPFVSPESLWKSEGELGWKGSAATSAFRPTEPRKVLELPPRMFDFPAGKQGRPPLDIDLNVADERSLEDITSQVHAQKAGSKSGSNIANHGLGSGKILPSTALLRFTGGLNLDLNRINEDTDIGQSSTSHKFEVPLLPVRLSSSGGFPKGDVNIRRDFDLNNGPTIDELSPELAPYSHHAKSSVPFLPPELGNISSWFPMANSYPSVPIPSNASSQRILGPSSGGATIAPDMYRGSVLSSPALGFSSTSSFQYPAFPFGTSFPLQTASFSGSSLTYVDSSSGGGLFFPSVPSQLVGSSSAVSSHYPRPFMMSLSDGTTANSGAESMRKRGRHGLDLNSGPGGADIERREERLPSSSRQISNANSQALISEEQLRMYQAAGGIFKRKEPEGGWDAERFSYRQPAWQ